MGISLFPACGGMKNFLFFVTEVTFWSGIVNKKTEMIQIWKTPPPPALIAARVVCFVDGAILL